MALEGEKGIREAIDCLGAAGITRMVQDRMRIVQAEERLLFAFRPSSRSVGQAHVPAPRRLSPLFAHHADASVTLDARQLDLGEIVDSFQA